MKIRFNIMDKFSSNNNKLLFQLGIFHNKLNQSITIIIILSIITKSIII